MRKLKKIVILGGGESGVGAALLAKQLGHDIFLSDYGKLSESYREELKKNNLPYEEGTHTRKRIFEADEVIKSPGIPDNVAIIQELHEKGIPVISEIEFASRHTNAKIIAITGSNGKTTTSNLTYHLSKVGGLNVCIAGNVGTSFARNISEKKQYDYYILELSSFQLDGIVRFRPNIAILLNITPDHLDRYDYKMSNYARSKFRIAVNQTFDDLLILNNELGTNHQTLGISNEELDSLKARRNYVKMDFPEKHEIEVNQTTFELNNISLRGTHNQFNAICAVQVAQELGVPNERIQEGLSTFVNDPHRLEFIANINDVDYINDSKATNVDSVFYALQAMNKPIVWIAGGIDKGNDYSTILKVVEEKVKAIICLGADNSKLLEIFTPIVKNIEEAKGTSEAAQLASIYAEKGDVVLLSPACSSFDLFENYKKRGEKFKESVKLLK